MSKKPIRSNRHPEHSGRTANAFAQRLARSQPAPHKPAEASAPPSTQQRLLLMVDDRPLSLRGITDLITQQHPDWRVEVVANADAAMRRLHQFSQNLPDLISVDLGLEPLPDAPDVGLDLLRKIRRAFGNSCLVVHSALKVEPAVLHDIVGLRASYIQLRDQRQPEQAYAVVLPLLANGYLFYSPSVASQFSEILPDRPDPLDADEWQVARLLAEGKDYDAVARAVTEERFTRTNDPTYTMSMGRVQAIAREIGEKLKNAGFIDIAFDSNPTPNRYKPEIIAFYAKYHVKYRQ